MLRLSAVQLAAMVEHARAERPNECCGLIATSAGAVVSVHPARNAAASPLRYELDPVEQYRLQSRIEDSGLELGGIYHSHPRSAPVPSQTDITLAAYPDAVYVIVGLAGDEPEVRGWHIVDGQVSEADIEVDGTI